MAKQFIEPVHLTLAEEKKVEGPRKIRRALSSKEYEDILNVINNPPKAEMNDYLKQVIKESRRIKIVV